MKRLRVTITCILLVTFIAISLTSLVARPVAQSITQSDYPSDEGQALRTNRQSLFTGFTEVSSYVSIDSVRSDTNGVERTIDSPEISTPADIIYEAGDTGHEILWTVTNFTPISYELIRNNSVLTSAIWTTGTTLEVSIDNLDPTSYNYTLVVHDGGEFVLSDTVMVTVVDSTAPNIDHPEDVEYEARTTGHAIQWTASDLYPASFQILKNNSLLHSGYWTDTITISVDGLSPGTYDYTIVLFDESENQNTDSVQVEVVDTRAPVISRPSDITYIQGETGFRITWVGSDFYPATYSIYRNGSLLQEEQWDLSSTVMSVSIDGLDPGVYLYEIVLTDTSGNYIVDDVLVTVISPLDTLIPLALLATSVIVVVALYTRFRPTEETPEEDIISPEDEGDDTTTEEVPIPGDAPEEVARALMEERERISARVKEESERRIAKLDGSDTDDSD